MERLCGAGVLPFSITDDNRLVFVLAKERFQPNWKGSSRWSAFEGGAKVGETAISNAVREFAEESLCIFDDDEAGAEGGGLDATLHADLVHRRYSMRVNVVSDTRRGTTPTTACLHSTFVKQFRYTPDIVTLFERRRESLLTLKHAGDRLHAAWQSMPPAAYPFLREGSLVVRGCTPYVVHEVVDARVVGSEDTEVDDERLFVRISLALKLQAQAKVDADADDGDTQLIHHTFSADVTSRADAARSFEHWVRSREEAERAVERACAPPKSTEVARGTNGRLRSLRALPEYLEKSCIRYWSVQELHDALETRTRRPTDVYRPYFLIVLRAVLRTFDCVSANIPHVKWSEVRVG